MADDAPALPIADVAPSEPVMAAEATDEAGAAGQRPRWARIALFAALVLGALLVVGWSAAWYAARTIAMR